MKTWIDLHSHQKYSENNVFRIQNIIVGKDDIPENLPFSMGIHPWFFEENNLDERFEVLEKNVTKPNCYAIGECGLDKNVKIPLEIQSKIFVKHIYFAEKYQKPLIIHCVRAHNEIIQLKKNINPKMPWIMHGFNQKIVILDELIKNNFYISFGAAIFKAQSNAIFALLKIPKSHFFLETDDKNNSIYSIYEQASIILNLKIIDIQNLIHKNFLNIFKNE